MEKEKKEYIVKEIIQSEEIKKDDNLKSKCIAAIVSATIGIGGFVAHYNLGGYDSQNIQNVIAYITGFAGSLTSLGIFTRIFSRWLDNLDEKYFKKNDKIIDEKLAEYGYEKDEYYTYVYTFNPNLSVDEFVELRNSNIPLEKLLELKENNISLSLFQELNELNISISDYKRLLHLGIPIEEYINYKGQENEIITPDSFFVKNIEKELPKEKVVVASAIIAGASAITSIVGMKVNMTSDEIEHVITSGIISLSGIPIFIGSSATMIYSTLKKINLLKTYNQVTGKKYEKKKKEE